MLSQIGETSRPVAAGSPLVIDLVRIVAMADTKKFTNIVSHLALMWMKIRAAEYSPGVIEKQAPKD